MFWGGRVTGCAVALAVVASVVAPLHAEASTGADLVLTQVATSSSVVITVRNDGPDDATAVTLTDALSADGTFASLGSTGDEADCTPLDATGFSCAFGLLTADDTRQVTVNFDIIDVCAYVYSSVANATTTADDPDGSNNGSTAGNSSPGCTEGDPCEINPGSCDPCGVSGCEQCLEFVPEVDAGVDQDVAEGTLVTLVGTYSDEPVCTPIDPLGWEQVAGPTVVLDTDTDGNKTFTAPDSSGDQTLTFRFSAENGAGTGSDDVDIVVRDPNTAPTATDDSYGATEDTPLVVSAGLGVLANDSDPNNDALSALLGTGPSHGTLTLNADGSFTYSPTADYAGADSFTYAAQDPSGASSDPATVSITISAVDDPASITAAGGRCPTANDAVLRLSITDVDTALGDLGLAVSSSSTALTAAVVSSGGPGIRLVAVAGKTARQVTITITAGSATLVVPVFIGSNGADTITGSDGTDVVFGINGTDMIDGRAGNDLLCGGNGGGTILGKAGNDTIDGQRGDDTIDGGDDNDLLIGGAGNDRLIGAGGDDTLTGDGGIDSFNGGAGSDVFTDVGKGDAILG